MNVWPGGSGRISSQSRRSALPWVMWAVMVMGSRSGAWPMAAARRRLAWWSTRNIAVSAILAGHQLISMP